MQRSHSARLLAVAAVSGLALGGFALAAPAQAHNTLIGATPEADSIVSEQPGEIVLTTNDRIMEVPGEAGNIIQISGPESTPLFYGSGCVAVDGSSLRMPLVLGGEGTYTVDWRIASIDGHPIEGSYTFDWQPAAGEELAGGATEPLACGDPIPTAGDAEAPAEGGAGTESPTPAESAEPSESSEAASTIADARPAETPGAMPWIIGGAAALAGVAVAIGLVTRARRKQEILDEAERAQREQPSDES